MTEVVIFSANNCPLSGVLGYRKGGAFCRRIRVGRRTSTGAGGGFEGGGEG